MKKSETCFSKVFWELEGGIIQQVAFSEYEIGIRPLYMHSVYSKGSVNHTSARFRGEIPPLQQFIIPLDLFIYS